MTNSKLSTKVIGAFKWSVLSEIAAKILPPVTFLITARWLTPSDFGLAAISAMVLAFAGIFWEAGLSKALIQNQNDDQLDEMTNVVFFSNFSLGLLVYCCILIFSDAIAHLFNDERISSVLRVSGLVVVISSFVSVQTALFQKDFAFRNLFYCRLISAVGPGIIAVVLACLDYGFWALIWGSVISSLLQALLLWNLSTWRPRLCFDAKVAKELFNYAKWIMASALLVWFFSWGDLFVVGYFFSSHETGLYRTGNYFVTTVIGLFTVPVIPVLFSYFSKIQHDIGLVKKNLLRFSKIVTSIVLPISVGIFLIMDPLANLFFGQKWQGVDMVIGYLALVHGSGWIIGLNNEAYKAVGRPDIESKILFFSFAIYALAYWYAAQVSFYWFIVTRLLLAIFGIFIHVYASKRVLSLGLVETFLNIRHQLVAVILAAVMGSVLFGPIQSNISMVGILFFCLFTYLFILSAMDQHFFKSIFRSSFRDN